MSLKNTNTQTVTVTTTDQWAWGVSTTFTLQAAMGQKDVDFVSATWALTLSFNYQHTVARAVTETQTIELNYQQVITQPPMSKWKAIMTVNIGKIPATTYHTKATRWYNVPVSGATKDPTHNNLYKRIEDVTVQVEGSLASNTHIDITSTPLTGTTSS